MANGYMRAGAALGDALFGNGRAAYDDQMSREYKNALALGEARKATAAAVLGERNNAQRQTLNNPDLLGRVLGGDVGARNEFLTAALLSNPEVSLKTLGEGQDAIMRQAVYDRATSGDLGGAGAASLGLTTKPLEMTKIAGDVAYNPYAQPDQTVNVTPLGEATIGQRRASAASSYASANNSNASAARTRQAAGIDAAKFGLEREGRWNPGGKPAASSGGSGGSTLGGDLNPRQRVAVQGVQRNLLEYASALTGTSMDKLRGMTADEIGKLVEDEGGRYIQGGTARTLSRLPGGQLLGEVNNADILSYSQGAGAAWAAYENPTGMITNADRETSTAQMPTYLDPPKVQSRKIRSFLELSGYQPTLGDAPAPSSSRLGRPANAPAPGTIRNGYRFRGGNPADRNSWEKI